MSVAIIITTVANVITVAIIITIVNVIVVTVNVMAVVIINTTVPTNKKSKCSNDSYLPHSQHFFIVIFLT